jgi:hypothetical protein
MARRNEYTYSKRQRELKKRKKLEEKRQKKLARKGFLEDGVTPIPDPDAPEATPDGTPEGVEEGTAEETTAPDQESVEDPRPDANDPA